MLLGDAFVRAGSAGRDVTVSAVGETKVQGTEKAGDRKNYAGLLRSPAPCLPCSGRWSALRTRLSPTTYPEHPLSPPR